MNIFDLINCFLNQIERLGLEVHIIRRSFQLQDKDVDLAKLSAFSNYQSFRTSKMFRKLNAEAGNLIYILQFNIFQTIGL